VRRRRRRRRSNKGKRQKIHEGSHKNGKSLDRIYKNNKPVSKLK
tara:strand:- start:9197 stop:9328 length:132 start_codon:yes stop_codon:yes gene_type:complete